MAMPMKLKKIKLENESVASGKMLKNPKRKSTESVEAFLTDVSGMKSKKKKFKMEDCELEQPGKFEKGKKKPLNVINTAAKKLKKLKNGDQGDGGDKLKKDLERKIEVPVDDAKQKMEEMKFRDRKKVRRDSKPNANTAQACKFVWEQLRRHSISSDKKEELSNKLYALIKGHAKELIFAHDTSRVIQCLVKNGTQAHRNGMFEELKDEIVTMSKTKYAKFFVRTILECGKKEQRLQVFTALYGHVKKLIKHQEAADIVELAYNDYANAQQRSALVEEFYGPSFALFKTKDTRTLGDILTAHPEKKHSILDNMKDVLTAIIDKNICQYSIVHRVFLEYFTYATEKARSEMIEVVRESLAHMVHTRDGARVAMQCIWNGTAKDRKVIVKSLKSYILKICQEEYGHLVLLAIFDSVDDTKLVQKVILEEMLKSISSVAGDQHGRKVLYYLITPRNTKHFHPDILRILVEGDNNTTSKKEVAVRREELLAAVSKPLIKFAKDNFNELIVLNSTMLLYTSIINNCQGDVKPAMAALAAQAAKPLDTATPDQEHIVEHAFGHLVLKRLITHDKDRIPTPLLFTRILLETVPEENLATWTQCNRACFILVSLLDLEDAEVTKTLKRVLGPLKTSLEQKESKGAELLSSKLK